MLAACGILEDFGIRLSLRSRLDVDLAAELRTGAARDATAPALRVPVARVAAVLDTAGAAVFGGAACVLVLVCKDLGADGVDALVLRAVVALETVRACTECAEALRVDVLRTGVEPVCATAGRTEAVLGMDTRLCLVGSTAKVAILRLAPGMSSSQGLKRPGLRTGRESNAGLEGALAVLPPRVLLVARLTE